MVIIELVYTKPLSEVDKHLVSHRAFLRQGYQEGKFIASGPKNPRDGGIIVALGSKEEVTALMKNDPFHQHDIASYHFTEFDPVLHCEALNTLLK